MTLKYDVSEGRGAPVVGTTYHACVVTHSEDQRAVAIAHYAGDRHFVVDVCSDNISADESERMLKRYSVESKNRLTGHYKGRVADDVDDGGPALSAVDAVFGMLMKKLATQ
jgi:hypothetical protein